MTPNESFFRIFAHRTSLATVERHSKCYLSRLCLPIFCCLCAKPRILVDLPYSRFKCQLGCVMRRNAQGELPKGQYPPRVSAFDLKCEEPTINYEYSRSLNGFANWHVALISKYVAQFPRSGLRIQIVPRVIQHFNNTEFQENAT